MKRDGHNNVVFFVGPEVEHTPAFSKKTLFVVGFQNTATIEKHAKEHKTPHIFLGANHSFDAQHNTAHFAKTWNDQITYLLDKGYWVTLDYPAHQHQVVLAMLNPGIWQSRIFVPLLSVRIPHVETSSPNLTVKIDDVDFKSTNPGVWCMHFREVTDSNRFTDWVEYGTDFVIEQEVVASTVVEAPARKVTYIDVGDMSPADAKKMLDETRERMNNTEVGLDPDAVSKLKPDEVVSPVVEAITNPVSAAEAYAEGTTADPLSNKASKKPKVTK